jgi:hypothetical protein
MGVADASTCVRFRRLRGVDVAENTTPNMKKISPHKIDRVTHNILDLNHEAERGPRRDFPRRGFCERAPIGLETLPHTGVVSTPRKVSEKLTTCLRYVK